MKPINVTTGFYFIFVLLKATLFKNFVSKLYYILRISFVIDEGIIVRKRFKKHVVIGFFRIFKVVHRYYNYNLPILKYTFNDRFRFNIVSIIAGCFTASKVPFHCFETFKKIDDILFIYIEMKGRVKLALGNLRMCACNLTALASKLFFVFNVLVFTRMYIYDFSMAYEILSAVLLSLLVSNVYFAIRMLRNMDDIMISGYRIFINYKMLRSFLCSAALIRNVPISTVMAYHCVFATLKVMRKIFEIVLFFNKMTKKLNETSLGILRKVELLERHVLMGKGYRKSC